MINGSSLLVKNKVSFRENERFFFPTFKFYDINYSTFLCYFQVTFYVILNLPNTILPLLLNLVLEYTKAYILIVPVLF